MVNPNSLWFRGKEDILCSLCLKKCDVFIIILLDAKEEAAAVWQMLTVGYTSVVKFTSEIPIVLSITWSLALSSHGIASVILGATVQST